MNIASLFNLAGPDVIIIIGIVALLFGAKKLPELARGVGQAAREFVKAKDEPLIGDKKEPSQPSQPS
jgi:sec-independent protein translocase protein TatA